MDKQRLILIDKDALLKKLRDSAEIISTVDRCINQDKEDKLGSVYCRYLCGIVDAFTEIVEQQEEVTP